MKNQKETLLEEYSAPELEIMKFGATDIITTSDEVDAGDPEKVETEIDRLFGDPW